MSINDTMEKYVRKTRARLKNIKIVIGLSARVDCCTSRYMYLFKPTMHAHMWCLSKLWSVAVLPSPFLFIVDLYVTRQKIKVDLDFYWI